MITSAADFVYTTPPPNVSVDGDFLGSTTYPSGHPLMWQDAGFLMEACRERNVLCKISSSDYAGHQFISDVNIRKSNIIDASWFLHGKFSNSNSEPARAGMYSDTAYPVTWRGGNPMFVHEDGIGPYLTESITNLNSRTTHGYVPAGDYNQMREMCNEVYQSFCADVNTPQRPPEFHSYEVSALDSSQIVTLERGADSLRRVFYGFITNYSNADSYATVQMNTLPMFCEMGLATMHSQTTTMTDVGAFMQWPTAWYRGWNQWTTLVNANNPPFAIFNTAIQDKVVAATVWTLYTLNYWEDVHTAYPDYTYHIAFRYPLRTLSGTVTLADGVHKTWYQQGGYSSSQLMLQDALAKFGLSRKQNDYQYISLEPWRCALSEVLYKPNSSLYDEQI